MGVAGWPVAEETAGWFERYRVDWRCGANDLMRHLASDGLVTVTGVDGEARALEVARRLGDVRAHRDSAASGITRLEVAGETQAAGFRGFSDAGLFVHTDRSVAKHPPSLLFFWCEIPSEEGGETLLVDGRRVYEKLSMYEPRVFEAVTKPNAAVFASDGVFYCGAIYERLREGRLAVRFRYDELLYMAPPLAEAMPVFRGFLDASQISFRLAAGQGYILQNTRWLHGRRPFRGARRCGRLHIDPHEGERLHGFADPLAA